MAASMCFGTAPIGVVPSQHWAFHAGVLNRGAFDMRNMQSSTPQQLHRHDYERASLASDVVPEEDHRRRRHRRLRPRQLAQALLQLLVAPALPAGGSCIACRVRTHAA